MKNLVEKRAKATAWINNATEAEVDALPETIQLDSKPVYGTEIIDLLDTRWENYKS